MATRYAECSQTILVVDDAEAIRKMVCSMLTQSGYNCIEAADGLEALRLLDRTGQVELVLTDVVMPHMSGSDLAMHVSRTRPDVRIIFMSGYVEDPLLRNVQRTPALFLPKPFTADVLMEKIGQALALPWRGLPELRPG